MTKQERIDTIMFMEENGYMDIKEEICKEVYTILPFSTENYKLCLAILELINTSIIAVFNYIRKSKSTINKIPNV